MTVIDATRESYFDEMNIHFSRIVSKWKTNELKASSEHLIYKSSAQELDILLHFSIVHEITFREFNPTSFESEKSLKRQEQQQALQ